MLVIAQALLKPDSMGQEITTPHFKHHDFQRYGAALTRETALLQDWFAQNRFSIRRAVGGLEKNRKE